MTLSTPGTMPEIELLAMDVAGRADRLRARLDQAECQALLVTNITNIRYLTGFTGSAALLLVHPDELVLVSDGRYREQLAMELDAAGVEARVEISSNGQQELMTASAEGLAALGLEASSVTWAQQRTYANAWFPDTDLVPTIDLVEGLRQVKDEGEISRMEAAAAVADAALAAVRPSLNDEPTEEQFGLALDSKIRELGASGVAFETIVAAGANAARPHARPTSKTIVAGDLVVIDFGAMIDGYRSDMTRTIIVGVPDSVQARMLDTVLAAQARGVQAIGPGVEAKAIDAACRSYIDDEGWAEAFIHGTGHGVGLDIHEAPRVSKESDATLEAGHVVTVEPGIYLPEHGGVRIEDTVLVTSDGCRALTKSAKTTSVV